MAIPWVLRLPIIRGRVLQRSLELAPAGIFVAVYGPFFMAANSNTSSLVKVSTNPGRSLATGRRAQSGVVSPRRWHLLASFGALRSSHALSTSLKTRTLSGFEVILSSKSEGEKRKFALYT